MSRYDPGRDLVVNIEKNSLLTVTEILGFGGRADDVGEQHCCHDTVRSRLGSHAGEELLNRIKRQVRVLSDERPILARNRNHLSVRDVDGEVLGASQGYELETASVQDQCRDLNRSQ